VSTITWNKAVEKFCACVEGLGFEFVGAEMIGSGHKAILRIYADAAPSINIDQITQITHQLMGLIEVDLPTYRECTIEVSSPGLDRPLFKLADYQRFVGKKVRLNLHTPLEGQRHFTGNLIAVDAEQVTIKCDEKEVVLPFSAIEKAKLVPEISFK
jgi:ribosome maturation factor RimP